MAARNVAREGKPQSTYEQGLHRSVLLTSTARYTLRERGITGWRECVKKITQS